MSETMGHDRLTRGRGRGIRVAVVDSGWSGRLIHPRVMPAADQGDGAMDDRVGHGTHCALRVLQVAPESEVLPVRVFDDRLETSVERLCQGIDEAVRWGAQVVNLSLATRIPEALQPLYALCEEARRAGVIVVAAAHNGGGQAYPAYLEPVLSVAAGRQRDLLDFSYRHDEPIECTAASSGVPILLPDGASVRRAGSSIAAATTSGIVARLLEGGGADLDEVRSMLASITRLQTYTASPRTRTSRKRI
jgi:subtilisin family serine protease